MSVEEFQLFVCKSLTDALRPESEVRKMLRDEGTVREPNNSELLVYVAYDVLWMRMLSHFRIARANLRIGAEYYKLPLTQRLYDTTKSEKMNSITAANRSEKLIRRLMMHGIRLQCLNKDNVTSLHKVMTQVFSNFHSPELLTIGNKSGICLSYTADLNENKAARKTYDKECKQILNAIGSDIYFWNIDNLKTVMKWMNMLKEGDKLTDFMTFMLVFIEGHKQALDFYPKQSEHNLDKLHLTPTENDELIFNKFLEAILQYRVKLY